MKINLIYNKDISDLKKKKNLSTSDWEILNFVSENLLETKVQQMCHKLFQGLAFEYERKLGGKVMEFVQFDNGGKMGFAQKKKKKAEGTKTGIPDVGLFLGTPCGQYSKLILVEFKRIGTPSQIHISPEQQYYHDWFNSIGFESYITNNPVYFKNHILQRVKDFFKDCIK